MFFLDCVGMPEKLVTLIDSNKFEGKFIVFCSYFMRIFTYNNANEHFRFI